MQREQVKKLSVLQQDVRHVCETNENLKLLEGQTVLITGETGFVGSFLVRVLLEYSHMTGKEIHVIAMVRNKAKAEALFNECEKHELISYLCQDVRDAVSWDGTIDYIIHCASNAGPKEYGADPAGTMTTNFAGTAHLLELAREKNVKKFLYASTIEVYGAAYKDGVIGEHDFGVIDSTNVRSCYPISKKACETLAVAYADQYQVPAVIGRLSYLYGAGMKKDDSKVVAQFARNIAEHKNIVMKSTGEQLRSYTYISDAASALLTVLIKGEAAQAYNIANPESRITIAGMAEQLTKIYPDRNLKVVFDLPTEADLKRFSFIRDAVLDSSKLESLGFQASVPIQNGLKRMVESIEENQ